MKGAEAIIIPGKILERELVVKKRIEKRYREKTLDEKIRRERTRKEAKLLHRAKIIGVRTPTVYMVEEFEIWMEKIQGKTINTLDITENDVRLLSKYLALLHCNDIFHGDYTPANFMKTKDGKIYIIDFGLGGFSSDVEEKAVDLFLFLKSLPDKFKEKAIGYYLAEGGKREVVERMEKIKERARYSVKVIE